MKIESEYKYTISVLLEGKINKFIKEIIGISYINSKGHLTDSVDFQSDKIVITCSRKSDYGILEKLITEDNNTIIELIKKSIIYLGLQSKTILKIKKIEVSKWKTNSKSEKIYSFQKSKLNPFLKSNKKIKMESTPKNIDIIFKNKEKKVDYRPYYIACSRYLFSKLQGKEDYLEFIQLWSAYNSIYNIFVPKNDTKSMQCIKKYIMGNESKFQTSIEFCNKLRNSKLLPNFQWKILFIDNRNKIMNKKANQVFSEVVHTEPLVLKLYEDYFLPYLKSNNVYSKKADGKEINHYDTLKEYIKNNEKIAKNNDAVLLCFLVNEFIYKLRCNYIHGNEEGLQFSIAEYNEHEQLKTLIKLMDIFLVDLLNSFEELYEFRHSINPNAP
jgi:hypothetical protein